MKHICLPSLHFVLSLPCALGGRVTISGKTTLELGYKHMAVDFTRGGFTFDTATSDPMMGLSVRF